MNIFYQGKDITDACDVVACRHTDTVGRCDFLEMEMEHAPLWDQWQPAPDDEIRIEMDGYSTGKLYLADVLPEEDRYRLWAASMPLDARTRKNECFEDKTLNEVVSAVAASCGMQGKLYGLTGAQKYACLVRDAETAPEFIARILEWEGAYLKAMDGKLIGIAVEYAKTLKAVCEIELKEDEPGVAYLRTDGKRLTGIDIASVYAEGAATDTDGKAGRIVRGDLPVREKAEADRWARGMLTCKNAMAETLEMQMGFHPGFTAMSRVSIKADGARGGDWIIQRAEHEFIRGTTHARLMRAPQNVR